MSLRPLAVLIPLILSGCASQQALTEQSQAMQARLDRLEQSVKTMGDQGRARQDALDQQIAGLRTAVQGLADRAMRTDAGLDRLALAAGQAESERQRLAERTSQNELRLDELVTVTGAAVREAVEGHGRLTERTTQNELRLDELATVAGAAAQAAEAQDRLTERTTHNELRLDELATTLNGAASQSEADQAQLAGRLAQIEKGLAEVATGLPERLGRTEKRLEGLTAAVDEAVTLARQEQIRLNGKEAFTVLLTEDKTLYPINSPELGSQDTGKLGELATRLAGLEQEYHLEIQGHTDSLGTEDYNYELGKARADVVKRYLHEKKGIPLSRMSAISFGDARSLDRNNHRNRRILVRVLVPKEAVPSKRTGL